MIYFSPAKINLGLYVTGKREDGYHDIESIFLPVALYDAVELIESSQNKIRLYGLDIPGSKESNSCWKTLTLMQQKFSLKHYCIHLLKNNPMGAGIGGGSANSAAIIHLLNQMENLQLSVQRMESIALQIGSDNAFFIEATPKHVTGRGEVLNNCKLSLSNHQVVFIIPPVHQSTKEAYATVNFNQPTFHLQDLTDQDIVDGIVSPLNSFQASFISKFPESKIIVKKMKEFGAYYSSLTGSGAAFFGLFLPQQNIPTQLKRFAEKNHYNYIQTHIL